uniref:C3H1-type domain-containing protein n=1 Tax=Alexandrium monilatum TaxID=311494 RepID=A0A7S4UNV7_9DINO
MANFPPTEPVGLGDSDSIAEELAQMMISAENTLRRMQEHLRLMRSAETSLGTASAASAASGLGMAEHVAPTSPSGGSRLSMSEAAPPRPPMPSALGLPGLQGLANPMPPPVEAGVAGFAPQPRVAPDAALLMARDFRLPGQTQPRPPAPQRPVFPAALSAAVAATETKAVPPQLPAGSPLAAERPAGLPEGGSSRRETNGTWRVPESIRQQILAAAAFPPNAGADQMGLDPRRFASATRLRNRRARFDHTASPLEDEPPPKEAMDGVSADEHEEGNQPGESSIPQGESSGPWRVPDSLRQQILQARIGPEQLGLDPRRFVPAPAMPASSDLYEAMTAPGLTGALDSPRGLPSVGSLRHGSECKPCLFWYRGMCQKGQRCVFCHVPHDLNEVSRVRPSKKTRNLLANRQRR